MTFAEFSQKKRVHFTGVKGVAMTSLAQCCVDLGMTVTGSDVRDAFVTQPLLDQLNIPIFILTANDQKPPFVQAGMPDLLIYTSAHGGPYNPEVQWAVGQNIPTLSQAEALSILFNEKKGVAVCGVGGKSTVSAMITWILDKNDLKPSFSVGVGSIIGMDRTGRWNEKSEYFVAEADEYVTDPSAPTRGEKITPRFSYLHPYLTVCTNLRFDHPDVYKTAEDTFTAFHDFFHNIKPDGKLITHSADTQQAPIQLAEKVTQLHFGERPEDQYQIDWSTYQASPGKTQVEIITHSNGQDIRIPLSLSIPGRYNCLNAVAAVAACEQLGLTIEQITTALASFQSTQRRFEFKGEKNGILYYDDYAHHPTEIKAVWQALQEWYPQQRKIVLFQPHTYSRTKTLFTDFVTVLSQIPDVYLLDIFASARETLDKSISSDHLIAEIQKQGQQEIANVHSVHLAAQFIREHAQPGDIVMTLGAGDVYKMHELI